MFDFRLIENVLIPDILKINNIIFSVDKLGLVNVILFLFRSGRLVSLRTDVGLGRGVASVLFIASLGLSN